MKQKNTKQLKKALWKVFSLYVRMRDKGECISCGKRGDVKLMDAGHYIPKTGGLSIYFDEKNVHCQCTYCNRFMHGNLAPYAIALRQRYGETILEELAWKKQQITKYTTQDYQYLIQVYKEKLKTLS